jgi:hypothetical protein
MEKDQKNEIIRSIIIYFIFSILTVSSFTILSLNFDLIHITQEKTKFLSLLLGRNIIMPFLIIIFINFFYRYTALKSFISVVVLLILISLLEFLNLRLLIFSFVKWNFVFTCLLDYIFILIILIISKCINVIQKWSEKNNRLRQPI